MTTERQKIFAIGPFTLESDFALVHSHKKKKSFYSKMDLINVKSASKIERVNEP